MEALNENNVKDFKWWDKCKEKFKCEAIKHSIKKTKDFYKISIELENGLRQIEGLINGCIDNNIKEQLLIEKRSLLEQLGALFKERSQGAIIRSKCKIINENEQASSSFLKMETRRAKKNFIEGLKKLTTQQLTIQVRQ